MLDTLERLLGKHLARAPSQAMPVTAGGLLGYRRGHGPGLRDLAVTEEVEDTIATKHDRIADALAERSDLSCATQRQSKQGDIMQLRNVLAAQVAILRRFA